MFHLIGLKQNLENMVVLSKPLNSKILTGISELKSNYHQFLNKTQPYVPVAQEKPIEFLSDKERVSQLINIFNVDSTLNDIDHEWVTDEQSLSRIADDLNHVRHSVKRVSARYSEFGVLLELAVNMIFCAPSHHAGGGTTSAAIGVIWCDPRPTWSADDNVEFFVHELSHTLLFLDELRYQHYVDLAEVQKKENYAISAILSVNRPLDKVLHSLVVATEILLVRDRWIEHPAHPKLHPPSEAMILKSLASIRSILNLQNQIGLLTPRALDLIEQCQQKTEEVFKNIKKGLRTDATVSHI